MPTSSDSDTRNLRIIFMGTPEFAVSGLDHLVQNGYNIVGVITATDKPAGRGRKLQQSAVKKYALEQELRVLQPANLKDEAFIQELQSLKANLQIVVAFRMLPKVVWQMPSYGTFNLHASLLPDYRGAAPINWAIINGETETGVTTFFIDEKIDTGQIILQEKVAIDPDETAGELHDKLMRLGSTLILQTVRMVADDTIKPIPQNEPEELKLAPKIQKDTCQIDWTVNIKSVYDLIRGLSPYPAAWTTLVTANDELLLKIYEVEKEYQEHNFASGKIIADKKTMKVAVKEGFIILKKLQLQGKKVMSTTDLLNGLQLSENAEVR